MKEIISVRAFIRAGMPDYVPFLMKGIIGTRILFPLGGIVRQRKIVFQNAPESVFRNKEAEKDA